MRRKNCDKTKGPQSQLGVLIAMCVSWGGEVESDMIGRKPWQSRSRAFLWGIDYLE